MEPEAEARPKVVLENLPMYPRETNWMKEKISKRVFLPHNIVVNINKDIIMFHIAQEFDGATNAFPLISYDMRKHFHIKLLTKNDDVTSEAEYKEYTFASLLRMYPGDIDDKALFVLETLRAEKDKLNADEDDDEEMLTIEDYLRKLYRDCHSDYIKNFKKQPVNQDPNAFVAKLLGR